MRASRGVWGDVPGGARGEQGDAGKMRTYRLRLARQCQDARAKRKRAGTLNASWINIPLPKTRVSVLMLGGNECTTIARRRIMAGFKTHVTVSAALGAAAGFYGYWYWNLDWGPICLIAGLTTLGGMLPDLDSDSGIPVRELFGLAGAFLAVLLLHRLRRSEFSQDQLVVILMGTYLLVRYGLSEYFKRLTVHRGMFHSIPALVITGLIVFLVYDHDDL